ncbi:hypothetical protein Esti_005187 [Eimeria stiedai]
MLPNTEESASLFAGSQAASRVPVSNKQLKQRDQAKVQLVGEVLTHRETAEEGKEGEEERRKKLKEWRVVLHNDDVHTFECVEVAITKILPQVSRARAYDIALHAHTNGKATIMLTWEQKAREVALGEEARESADGIACCLLECTVSFPVLFIEWVKIGALAKMYVNGLEQ